jgi:hypothetical protein
MGTIPRRERISKRLSAAAPNVRVELGYSGFREGRIHADLRGGTRSFVLLHETHVGDWGGLGDLSDGAELLLVAPDIFLKRPQDSFRVPRAYDHA